METGNAKHGKATGTRFEPAVFPRVARLHRSVPDSTPASYRGFRHGRLQHAGCPA